MLRRLQAGYYVDSIEHNSKLVNNFADSKHLFTQQDPTKIKPIRCQRAFWTWLKTLAELTETDNNSSKFLSKGIIKVFKEDLDRKKEEKRFSQESIHGFTVYTSPMRDELIKLCGWSQVVQSISESADILSNLSKRKHSTDKQLIVDKQR